MQHWDRFSGSTWNEQHRNWDQNLEAATFAINSVTNADTGYSPFYLMYAREPAIPEGNLLEHLNQDHEEYDFLHLAIAPIVRTQAAEGLTEQQERWKQRWNEKHPEAKFKEGERVMVKEYQTREGLCRKLQPKYSGPYLITKVHENNTVDLDAEWTRKSHRITTARIFKFTPRDSQENSQSTSETPEEEEHAVEREQVEEPERRRSTRNRIPSARFLEGVFCLSTLEQDIQEQEQTQWRSIFYRTRCPSPGGGRDMLEERREGAGIRGREADWTPGRQSVSSLDPG